MLLFQGVWVNPHIASRFCISVTFSRETHSPALKTYLEHWVVPKKLACPWLKLHFHFGSWCKSYLHSPPPPLLCVPCVTLTFGSCPRPEYLNLKKKICLMILSWILTTHSFCFIPMFHDDHLSPFLKQKDNECMPGDFGLDDVWALTRMLDLAACDHEENNKDHKRNHFKKRKESRYRWNRPDQRRDTTA